MCGIIGIQTADYNGNTLALLNALLLESQIRGKHATGIAWNKFDHIETNIKPIPARDFVKCELGLGLFGKPISIIAHCRYSTSDLEYNQPIANLENAVVHNGVITQKDPSHWHSDYGYICKTRNDSELALKAIESHFHPLAKFDASSIALIHLERAGGINFYRNGARPLWHCLFEDVWIIASTKNIIERAFDRIKRQCPELIKCEAGINYSLTRGQLTVYSVAQLQQDRQVSLPCSEYYSKLP